MKRILGYSLVVFLLSLMAAAIVVAMSLYHVSEAEKKAFSQTLTDLGDFGSFLSGVATLAASAVAAVGVGTWRTQIKVGKYLGLIWDAKISVGKVRSAYFTWYAYSSQSAFSSSEQVYSIKKSIDDLGVRLNKSLDELIENLGEIDSVVNNNWLLSNQGRFLKVQLMEVEHELSRMSDIGFDKYDVEEIKSRTDVMVKLNNGVDGCFNSIGGRLNELEKEYSE